jgi:hypothetical protein
LAGYNVAMTWRRHDAELRGLRVVLWGE